MPPKWLTAPVAVVLTVIISWIFLWLQADRMFRHAFLELRFMYYAFPIGMMAISIAVLSIRGSRSPGFIAWPAAAAYLGSVVAYYVMALVPDISRVRLGIFLLAFFLPVHFIFVFAAVLASLSMQLFLIVCGVWARRVSSIPR